MNLTQQLRLPPLPLRELILSTHTPRDSPNVTPSDDFGIIVKVFYQASFTLDSSCLVSTSMSADPLRSSFFTSFVVSTIFFLPFRFRRLLSWPQNQINPHSSTIALKISLLLSQFAIIASIWKSKIHSIRIQFISALHVLVLHSWSCRAGRRRWKLSKMDTKCSWCPYRQRVRGHSSTIARVYMLVGLKCFVVHGNGWLANV